MSSTEILPVALLGLAASAPSLSSTGPAPLLGLPEIAEARGSAPPDGLAFLVVVATATTMARSSEPF